MGKNIDIDALGEKSDGDFEYQQFTSNKSHSNEQQRWKLLDSIAKHAPGIMQRGDVHASQAAIPPINASESKEALMSPSTATPRQEAIFKSSPSHVDFGSSAQAQPKQRSFSHLFEAYGCHDSAQQEGDSDSKGMSLKALLRQINS